MPAKKLPKSLLNALRKPPPAKKLLAKEERFAANLVLGLSNKDAALEAGYDFITCRGKYPDRLAKRKAIRERIEQIKAQGARRTGYTIERLIEEIEDVQRRASRAHEFSTELKCIEKKAALLGIGPKPEGTPDVNVNLIFKPLAGPTKELDLSPSEWAEKWSPKEITTNGRGNSH